MSETLSQEERARRWRLILGGASALRAQSKKGASQEGADGEALSAWGTLSGEDQEIDEALTALYGSGEGEPQARGASLGDSAPHISRWLGEIQRLFPQQVAQVMQRDALERLELVKTLSSPELSALITPDVHLVSQLIALGRLIPDTAKESARRLIRELVDALIKRFEPPMRQRVMGSLRRQSRNFRPKHSEVDWHRTIKLNLKHYQPDFQSIIPERRVGFHRQSRQLTSLTLCVDQSGSMAPSVVYASLFAAVLARLPALKTTLVLFDTAVVDLTDELSDPSELLFGLQLGGGTNIGRALTYCEQQLMSPAESVMVLISDLFEGGEAGVMFERARAMVASGVRLICLLALSDDGTPSYDQQAARTLRAMGVPCFACTPDLFPDLMGVALSRGDCETWASARGFSLR